MSETLQKRADELLQAIQNLETVLKKRSCAFVEVMDLLDRHLRAGNITLYNPSATARASKFTLYLRLSEKISLQRNLNKRGLLLMASRYKALLKKYEEVRTQVGADAHKSLLKPFQNFSPMGYIKEIEEERYRKEEEMYVSTIKEKHVPSVDPEAVEDLEASPDSSAEESRPAGEE